VVEPFLHMIDAPFVDARSRYIDPAAQSAVREKKRSSRLRDGDLSLRATGSATSEQADPVVTGRSGESRSGGIPRKSRQIRDGPQRGPAGHALAESLRIVVLCESTRRIVIPAHWPFGMGGFGEAS